ncbi:hypothetical protein NDU88_005206 [Pleurodeles waltl]|uniref:Uncharacterized protein n=1 Tax=Pleurodeles waltl TaxID=8319 RepID=A0AAV7RJ01_PLEWA|nr:hypothetical protein NDU88_005206 [Pleurodeles waltl]
MCGGEEERGLGPRGRGLWPAACATTRGRRRSLCGGEGACASLLWRCRQWAHPEAGAAGSGVAVRRWRAWDRSAAGPFGEFATVDGEMQQRCPGPWGPSGGQRRSPGPERRAQWRPGAWASLG